MITANLRTTIRSLVSRASPVLVAQLAVMSTTVVDTAVAGRFSSVDLAAVGILSGFYVMVLLTFGGALQGITPIAAHLYGAKRFDELPRAFQQGLWLAIVFAVLGVGVLVLTMNVLVAPWVDSQIVERGRPYLYILCIGLPGALVFRACGAMLNALGKPRLLMLLGLGNACLHALLAPALAFGWLGYSPLGAVGSACSTSLINTLLALAALTYFSRASALRQFRLLARWQRPQPVEFGELLRIGLPIGMSWFVDITGTALIGFMVAPLGLESVGAQRILGGLGSICHMVPMSVGIAAMALIGQASGAGENGRLRLIVVTGMSLAVMGSCGLGILMWLFATPVVSVYTTDPAVHRMASSLLILIMLNQLGNALQAVAAQSLRGLKITGRLVFVSLVSSWGVRLAVGWWLCFHGVPSLTGPLGLAGFLAAAIAASLLAAVIYGAMLVRQLRKHHPDSC